jgi:hypothetical protein
LNKVYIETKRAGSTSEVLTIFTEVDELDGNKDGHVTVE